MMEPVNPRASRQQREDVFTQTDECISFLPSHAPHVFLT